MFIRYHHNMKKRENTYLPSTVFGSSQLANTIPLTVLSVVWFSVESWLASRCQRVINDVLKNILTRSGSRRISKLNITNSTPSARLDVGA